MTDGEPSPGADEPDPEDGSDPADDADPPAEAPDDADPAEDADSQAETPDDDADPAEDADSPAETPDDDADPADDADSSTETPEEDADPDDGADPAEDADSPAETPDDGPDPEDGSEAAEDADSPAETPVDEPLPPADAEDDRIDAPADAAGADDGAGDDAAGDEDSGTEEAADTADEGPDEDLPDEGAPDSTGAAPADDPPLEPDPVAQPPRETDPAGEPVGPPRADDGAGAPGEGAADDAGPDSYGTEVDAADVGTGDSSGLGPSAPDDQELPLAVHIEEMVKRLLVVIAVMAVVSVIVFPLADRLINFIWFSFLPGSPEACSTVAQAAYAQSNLSTVGGNGTGLLNGTSALAENATGNLSDNTTAAIANGSLNASQTVAAGGPACPRLYHPLSLVLARLKVASLVGFVIALPVFVYQTYAFMRPGLYPNERRYYLASVPTSLILAAIGIAFAHLLVLPVIFTYFVTYSEQATTLAFGLQQTFDLMLLMFGLFAVVFQIPLFIMLAIMMGVTSREWLTNRRLYFWAGFAGIAFLFAPEPTGMAPFLTAATMIVLFEVTLLLLRWTGR